MKTYRGQRWTHAKQGQLTSYRSVVVIEANGARPLIDRGGIRCAIDGSEVQINLQQRSLDWGNPDRTDDPTSTFKLTLALLRDCCPDPIELPVITEVEKKLIHTLADDGWLLTEKQLQRAVEHAKQAVISQPERQ